MSEAFIKATSLISNYCISYMVMITSMGSKCAKWVTSTGRLGKMVSCYRAVVTIITFTDIHRQVFCNGCV